MFFDKCLHVPVLYVSISPSHRNTAMAVNLKEISMNNPLSSKLAALSAALIINAMMLGSVALLFNAHVPIGTNAVASQITVAPSVKS